MNDAEELDEVEDPYQNLDFFPIMPDEAFLVYELSRFVQNLIADSRRTPEDLKNLAIVKLGLQRLPRTTRGVHIRLGVVYRFGGDMNYSDFTISSDEFSLSQGGYVTGDFGGDSFSNTVFECESTGFRDGSVDAWEIGTWLATVQELINMGAVLSFENYSDENEIEWDVSFEKDPWAELEERIRRMDEFEN